MDVHIPGAITLGLRRRGIDVLTSQEDLTDKWEDEDLIARATALSRVMFSMDADLRREAVKLQRAGIKFHGLIAADQLRVTIGQCVEEPELIAKGLTSDDLANTILYLPLR